VMIVDSLFLRRVLPGVGDWRLTVWSDLSFFSGVHSLCSLWEILLCGMLGVLVHC
jgi:hypothetical protein